eukprot:918946-Prorocentrum_minimum.AAC.2
MPCARRFNSEFQFGSKYSRFFDHAGRHVAMRHADDWTRLLAVGCWLVAGQNLDGQIGRLSNCHFYQEMSECGRGWWLLAGGWSDFGRSDWEIIKLPILSGDVQMWIKEGV